MTYLLVVFMMFTSIFAAKVPQSNRSIQIQKNLEAKLKQEFIQRGFQWGAPIYLRSFKKEMKQELWIKKNGKFELYKEYGICTYGGEGLGPKLAQGDGMAPEGFYFVKANQMNPSSSYHLSFNLGYPNAYDRAHQRTGSFLMVHGECVSIGCYAMTNTKIEEIYLIAQAALEQGQPYFRAHLFPFKMTQGNLNEYKANANYDFWKNLKEGYDLFEEKGHLPPNVNVRNGKYIFD